jgi:hypothetical protein
VLIPVLLGVTNGCDDRVAQVAREAADRQAQQNTEMAQLNKEVASGSHQLVEADAKARQEIVGVHHDLQNERGRLDTSRSELESERREIADQRRTESMLVSLASAIGGVSLVVTLLGFCWYVLVVACRGDGTDAQLNELLIREILSGEALPMSSSPQAPSFPGRSGQTPRLKA